MTATARVAATTAASTAYTGSIASGVTVTFAGLSMLRQDKPIVFEIPNAAGDTYEPLRYLIATGDVRTAELSAPLNTIQLTGPIDYRINKPVTTNAVEIVEYS